MNHTEQRKRLRAMIGGPKCHLPASVFDALSARVAESVGYEIGILAGSRVSVTTLAAPGPYMLHTITEYADQVRRIMRVSKLSLVVDGDHGYGNALNVMRTVQELEHAGASAISIEDMALPVAFGQVTGNSRLISIEEGVGKMRAALAARQDPSLIIVARTSAHRFENIDSAVARAKAYAATGVDMFSVAGGIDNLDYIKAIHAAANLPMILSAEHGSLTCEDLAAYGVRILNPGHHVILAALKTLREAYVHLQNGGVPAGFKSGMISAREMEQLLDSEGYEQRMSAYMR